MSLPYHMYIMSQFNYRLYPKDGGKVIFSQVVVTGRIPHGLWSLSWSLVPCPFWGVPQPCHCPAWRVTQSCHWSCLVGDVGYPTPVTGPAQGAPQSCHWSCPRGTLILLLVLPVGREYSSLSLVLLRGTPLARIAVPPPPPPDKRVSACYVKNSINFNYNRKFIPLQYVAIASS